MKNVKKLLKKAMVFTLAASMLVGTPLTASAAGIRGVYSVSDGTNNDIGGTGDNSHTGTVTNTNTNSGALQENAAKIIGIALDTEHVDTEVGKQPKLKATVVVDGTLTDEKHSDATQEAILDALASNIKWEVLNPDGKTTDGANKVLSIAASATDRTVVTLNPRQGTNDGNMIVRAKIDGSYWFEAVKDENGELEYDENGKLKLITHAESGESYEAKATVYIKEYTNELLFDNPMPPAYLKHTLDLNGYITRIPETANDEITWISTNTKAATVTAAGVVTFKKAGETGSIIAVGEKCDKVEWTFKVDEGQQSSRIEIVKRGSNEPYVNAKNQKKKADVDIAEDDRQLDACVVMYAKIKNAVVSATDSKKAATSADDAKENARGYVTGNVEVKNGDPYYFVVDGELVKQKDLEITDVITWTSNKPAVVSVDGDDDEAVLYANGVGTAVITAKASSGKTDKLTVTVKATLKDLTIENDVDQLYSGQSMQMIFSRDPEENKDGVKWSIAKVEDSNGRSKANPNATINAKGVLTIKPKIDPDYEEVWVVLESKTTKTVEEDGRNVKKPLASNKYKVTVSQSSIDGITVKDDAGTKIARVYTDNGKVKQDNTIPKADNTTSISVPKGKVYTATVDRNALWPDTDVTGTEALTWTSSNAKIASVEYKADGKATITANANGKATITVSGIRAVEKNNKLSASVIKTTFKVEVKQPVKTVTLNKPLVVLNKKTQKKQGVDTTVDQKVALKATLGPKGVKKEAVDWSVKKIAGEGAGTPQEGPKNARGEAITAVNATITLRTPEIGDVFEITARTASGASATSTVKIVSKTTGVAITTEEGLNNGQPVLFEAPNNAGKMVANTYNPVIGQTFKMRAFINTGDDWKEAGTVDPGDVREDVTYTVNKKGIVNIDSDGTVHVINSGTVTITAKTPLNKKATLKVTVAKPAMPTAN